MNCKEMARLLQAYDTATLRLLEAVDCAAVAGTSPIERERWERTAEDARRICGETTALPQLHRLAHQC